MATATFPTATLSSPAVEIGDATKSLTQSTGPVLAGLRGAESGLPGAPRVKSVAELYTHAKSAATYDQSSNELLAKNFAGQAVLSCTEGDGQHPINHASQFEKAICGAWFLYSALASASNGENRLRIKLSEHDLQLVNFALHEMPFTGPIGYDPGTGDALHFIPNRKLFDYERKALLDDVLSGGLEAAPIAFDDAIITTPLLHGELFPLVNLITFSRGRRIEAFSIGNPTFQWGVGEGTNLPLFNTDGLIAAYDNTIFPATGAMTIGLDFEEDSPVKVGDAVIGLYGEAAKNTLDFVIALGNSATQPQGVFYASGVAAVLSTNGGSGPPTLGDYSALQFALTKPYRNDRAVYISNDTTYARSRNLKTDPNSPSTDERRILGMDFQSYQTLGYRHRVQEAVPNGWVGFFDLSRYRMYRRAGLQIAVERGGATLALAHEQLIVCRMRFGGSLEAGGAGAIMTNAQN